MTSSERSKLSIWLEAIRLRTLPLSVAGIIAGSALAYRLGEFSINIFLPALATTLLLQILSNLANDYGDGLKGTDHGRTGPQRMVQSGLLSLKEIKSGIILTAILALISGIYLLYEAFGPEGFIPALSFFFIGILAIWAAIKYTVGKNAYGYVGLGDLFVMIFFGFISVAGSFYLYTHSISASSLLQSFIIGAFSTGVLHLNNMRDRENDKEKGKKTMAVILGANNQKLYFFALLISALICIVIDVSLTALHLTELINILITIPVFILLFKVAKIVKASDYNNYLKPLALSTFFYSLLLFAAFIL